MSSQEDLQKRWSHLYRDHLPALAKARDPAQKKWPVFLDHCMARIVLDNAVGVDRQWTEVVKQPAVKNMTTEQLTAAIELGERIATGEADIVQLDDRSLQLRGKRKAPDSAEQKPETKRPKRSTGSISSYFQSPAPPPATKDRADKEEGCIKTNHDDDIKEHKHDPDMSIQFKRINDSNLPPIRKQMLTLLCQIPRGRYSTYKAMADYITKTHHKTCARAVGSAMRNNPFAPEVPCHRVLASDGSLGGFCGSWGESGKFANEKHHLLYDEGVRFDSTGKVKGPPFRDFSA